MTQLNYTSKRDLNNVPLDVIPMMWNADTLSFEMMTQPLIDATNSNLYLALDGVEGLLGDIKSNQTNKTSYNRITDGTSDAEVATGPNTGAKGLRVFGGPTDPISDIPVYIDFGHHQIHEGEAYQAHFRITLGTNSSKDIRISVPNYTATTRTPHFVFEVIADAAADLFLYETPTFSANGTVRTIFNKNRNSTNTPGTIINEDPTVTAVGTMIWAALLAGSKSSVGSGDRSIDEWDLKANTEYLLRLTTGTSAVKAVVRINFYEDLGV